jgi:hypothetical protein
MPSHLRSKLLNGENIRNVETFFSLSKKSTFQKKSRCLLLPSISGEQKLAGRGGTWESEKRKGGAGYEADMQRHGPQEHLEPAVTLM